MCLLGINLKSINNKLSIVKFSLVKSLLLHTKSIAKKKKIINILLKAMRVFLGLAFNFLFMIVHNEKTISVFFCLPIALMIVAPPTITKAIRVSK